MKHVAVLMGGRPAERRVSRDRLKAERYVAGEELALAPAVIEIQPVSGGFDRYDAKYARGGAKRVLSAKLKPKIYHEVQNLALKARRALGRRGLSRADFRRDDSHGEDGDVVRLEVDSQPGMTETSLASEIAAYAGVSFGELVEWKVEGASCDR